MFAVIETGGKQYKVTAGEKLRVEKLFGEVGSRGAFERVLLKADGEKIEIGTPHVENTKVGYKVLAQARDKKKIVFRYHSKTRYRKKNTHRQDFTEVEIEKII